MVHNSVDSRWVREEADEAERGTDPRTARHDVWYPPSHIQQCICNFGFLTSVRNAASADSCSRKRRSTVSPWPLAGAAL